MRLDLYRYATADNADESIALMRLFTGTLLADLSAAEAAELLASIGVQLSADDVENRCRQLATWGKLARPFMDSAFAPASRGADGGPAEPPRDLAAVR